MSSLSYAGLDIVNPCTVLGYSQTPEHDSRGNYLRTAVRIHVRGYYNVKSTGGKNPVATDVAIRDQLAQPRQSLQFVNGETIITSAGVDANNGPFCRVIDVREMMGSAKTWEVELVIETFTNALAKSALIANSWRIESDTDGDWYSTIVTRGRAVFSTKLLAGASPDSFRNKLIGSVPVNFKRDSIQVAVDEDGATVDYVVVDREQPINLIAKGVTRIEATFTAGIRNPGAEAMAMGVLGAVGEGLAQAITIQACAAANATAVAAVPAVTTGLGTVALATGLNMARAIYNNLPKTYGSMSIRVWGQRGTSKDLLYNVAKKVLLTRMNLFNLFTASTNCSVTEDVAGRFVSLDASFECGPVGSLVQLAGGVAVPVLAAAGNLQAQIALVKRLAVAFDFPPFPASDDIPGVFSSAPSSQYPPGDGGTRGTYLGQLVAAALLGPGQAPAKPA